jgi:hypothetical protein
MSEFRELSKLPADQTYWDRLETRILAVGAVRAGWWEPLANRAIGLSGLAVAAGVAALLLVPPRTQNGIANLPTMLQLPDDPAMAAFLSSPEPPSLGSLMASLLRSAP